MKCVKDSSKGGKLKGVNKPRVTTDGSCSAVSADVSTAVSAANKESATLRLILRDLYLRAMARDAEAPIVRSFADANKIEFKNELGKGAKCTM